LNHQKRTNQKRVIIVTGGSKGIGRAIALELCNKNSIVIIISRSKDTLKIATEAINDNNQGTCIGFSGDVSNYFEMNQIFDQILKKYGKIDVLVNNAGINSRKGILDLEETDWDFMLGINLKGTFICSKIACKFMARQKNGVIINISSVGSKRGSTCPAYAASKAGVNGLSTSLAREMSKYGVRVNVVAPGAIETDMSLHWSKGKRKKLEAETLLGRIGTPLDVAKAVAFLASEAANYITGEILDVNGGIVLD
jgi:3-oxoacyl-[acyl-carrier protein] reductase